MTERDAPVTEVWPVPEPGVRHGPASQIPCGPGPDLSRCFGRYRAQTPQYALVYCVNCPKLKSCVRTAWGVDEPRRTTRWEVWWERSPRGRAAEPPPGSGSSVASLAT